MKKIINFIRNNTSGPTFVLFLAGGVAMSLFFLLFRDYHYIDFDKIKYVLAISAVWFILSDIVRKKEFLNRRIQFIIDSIFYLGTFGLIVYFTGGMHGDFYALFFLATIASAIFGTVPEVIIFLIILTVESYLLCIFVTEHLTIYHLGVTTVYVTFYFIIAGFIKYLYYQIQKSVEISKKAELEAKISEKKYSDLIENTPLCIKVFDEKGNLIFLNKGGREEHFIGDDVDITKWDWAKTIKEEFRQLAKEKFENAIKKGESSSIEFEHTPEGSKHQWCSSEISPIKDEKGNIKSILFYSFDITQRKIAEIDSKNKEEMFKALLDATPICIKWFDNKGNLMSINKEGKEEHFLENKNDEEIKNWNFLSCIKPEYHEKIKEKIDLALRGIESSFEIEHTPEGSKNQWCLSNFTPVKDNKGQIKYILFLSRGITNEKLIDEERKKNFQKMEAVKSSLYNILEDIKETKEGVEMEVEMRTKDLSIEHSKLLSLIEGINLGIIMVDLNFNVIMTNEEARKFIGKKSSFDPILFKDIESKFKDINLSQALSYYVQGSSPLNINEVLIDNKYYRIFMSAVRDVKEQIFIGAVMIIEDITEHKMIDRMRSEIISITSHQMRTPLSVIKGNLEMILDGDLGKISDEQKEVLKEALAGDDRMIKLINDLMDVSKITEGKLGIKPEPNSMEDLVSEIVKELKVFAEKNEVSLIYKPPTTALPKVNIDLQRMRQVIQNLIDNAIKYSHQDHQGKVEVRLEKESDKLIKFIVSDNGIGIPGPEQAKIFERFFRASNATKADPGGGTGLGAFIMKSIVEQHKGKIWFESEEGKGTTFYITLPV